MSSAASVPPEPDHAHRILVADDEPDIRRVVTTYLELEGFEVYEAVDGRDAVDKAIELRPDLVILDIMMPNLSGTEALAELRNDFRTAFMPVVFLTAKSLVGDKVGHLLAGADDYIVKPFDPQELVARVEVALRRSRALRGLNPLTGLPGNTVIIEETQKLLDASQSFAFLYADLDNFKAYNDHYSFQRGDEVIRALGSAILASLEATPSTARFAGHVGGDDYVAIVEADRGEAVAEDICKRFDAEIRNHYDPDDRERGWIEVEDRRGQVTRFGLCSVSIGIVISSTRGYDNAAEVIAIAAEVKGVAKRTQGSSWAVDRRRD